MEHSNGSAVRGCSGGSISTNLVETVADASGVDATALPPLYERVDPDALESLFAATAGTSRTGQVEFSYGGYDVRIVCDGEVTISLGERSDGEFDSPQRSD